MKMFTKKSQTKRISYIQYYLTQINDSKHVNFSNGNPIVFFFPEWLRSEQKNFYFLNSKDYRMSDSYEWALLYIFPIPPNRKRN